MMSTEMMRPPKRPQQLQHERRMICPPRLLSKSEKLLVGFYILVQAVIFSYFRHLRRSTATTTSHHNTAGEEEFAADFPRVLSSSNTPFVATAGSNDDDHRDLESSMSYLRSFRSLERRKLVFLHIPKTAGTAIEQVSAERNISWGNCMFPHKPRRSVCPHPTQEGGGAAAVEWPGDGAAWWHLPSQFFPLARSNPYQGAEIFGVLRDPMDRFVSEFYYACTLKHKEWRPNRCDRTRLKDAGYMNRWLSHKIQTDMDHPALGYLMDNGHFTPQYEYVMGPHEVRMLDYVLLLDPNDKTSLTRDFRKLMEAFGLPLELREMQSISSHEEESSNSSMLTVKDLTESTKTSIRTKYRDDLSLITRLIKKPG